MKVAYLAENHGIVAQPWRLNGDGLMNQTGHNIGNMAFWYAARLLFDAELHLVGWHTKASQVPADVAALVIPAANFINATADLSRLAALVRELNRPVFLLGIGVQAESEEHPPEVKPSVVEFLQEVAQRTPTICVRGEFTAKVCESFGITNTRILGCPSILINPRPDLGAELARRIAAVGDGPLAIHAACVKHNLQTAERELVRLARLNQGSSYVVQRPVEFIKVAHGEALAEKEQAYFEKSTAFLGFGTDQQAFTQFLRSTIYVPDSVDSWVHYLQRFSAAVNTRIHGTVMSLTAGIPGICVHHDTRTRELSRQLRTPNIDVRQFLECRHSLRDLFDRSAFDGAAFDANRASAAGAYARILREIGLTPSRHLLSLASDDAGESLPKAA
jgi:hypothetical protein